MEQWQQICIRDNLVELTRNTTVNTELETILLEGRVLSDVEVEQLESELDRKGKRAASKMLFDFLTTRRNAYKILGKAAFQTKQSGTFLILLKGLIKHLLEQSKVELDDNTINGILQPVHQDEHTLSFYLNKVDHTTLFEDNFTLKPRPDIYISRHISNRVKLKPEVFKQKCPDVFVFSGLTRYQLTALAKPNRTALSRDVLLRKTMNSRFVFLQYEEDWDNLRGIYSQQDNRWGQNEIEIRSAHLIHYDEDSNEYILQQSTGTREAISKHVPPELRVKSLYDSEQDFCRQVSEPKHRQGICICDTPGMGKTWLLENIARGVQEQCSGRVVVVISLSELVQHLNVAEKLSDAKNQTKLQTLLQYLRLSPVISSILEKALDGKKMCLDLFLDGFDEIPKEHLKSTQQFFSGMAKSENNIRMFVTSRPHMRQELVDTFEATVYDILPFSEENQIDYLVNFWKASGAKDNKNLRKFAKACLQKLKASLKKGEGDLMGIPLQCFLLASVNLLNAKTYESRKDTVESDEYISATSMFDMYKQYVKMGVAKAVDKHVVSEDDQQKNNDDTGPSKKAKYHSKDCIDIDEITENLRSYHVWKALQLLYPDLAEDYFQSKKLQEKVASPIVLACGILQATSGRESSNAGEVFLHRTFAEFLVAELFAEIIVGQHQFENEQVLNKFVRVFVQDVLSVHLDGQFLGSLRQNGNRLTINMFGFKNAVTICFLNASLDSYGFNGIVDVVARCAANLAKEKTFSSILIASIASSFVQIIRLLKSILCIKRNKDDIRALLNYATNIHSDEEIFQSESYLSSFAYLCIAADYSNVEVVEELYYLFEECLEENLDDICEKMPTKAKTPMHYAAKRCEYDIVEFFIDKIPISRRNLLYHCLEDTKFYTQDEWETAIEICKMLIEKCASVLQVKHLEEDLSPFFANSVHVELIKFLVQKKANLHVTNQEGDNIVSFNGKKMEPDEFQELCRFLIFDVKAFDVFKSMYPIWKDPLLNIIGKIDEAALLMILQVPGINTQAVDDDGNNLILAAIKTRGHLDVIRTLANHGVDLHHKNIFHQGALHLVARTGDVNIAEYLVSKGIALNDQDDLGNSPLHHAVYKLELMKFLVSRNIDVCAVNGEGNNIAHLAAKLDSNLKRSNDVVDYLLTLENAGRLFGHRNESGKTPVDMLFASWDFPKIKNFDILLNLPEVEIPKENSKRENLLLLAVTGGQSLEVLQLLIKQGLDPFSVDRLKRTVLHLAVLRGNLEIVQYFVSLGVSLDSRDFYANTPLLYSVTNLEVAKYLIANKADTFAVDKRGRNLAHKFHEITDFCAGNFTAEMYQGLLKVVDKDGMTPLHYWIDIGISIKPSTIKQVVNIAGIDIDAVDKTGQTMFLTAVARNCTSEVLEELLKYGSDPKVVDKKGQNAFHILANVPFGIPRAELFLSLGISPHLQDNNENPPLLSAAKRSNLEFIKFMMEQNADILATNEDGENMAHLCLLTRDSWECEEVLLHLLKLPGGVGLFQMANKKGQTPLHKYFDEEDITACLEVKTVEQILRKSGADVHARDQLGNTVFIVAAGKSENLEFLPLLQKFEADVNSVNNLGNNALHHAIRRGVNLDVVKYLTSVGCDINHVNNKGYNPFQLAVSLNVENMYREGFMH